MTLRVRVSSVAPDLRFAVTGALAAPARWVPLDGIAVRAEGCLPGSLDMPRYLRFADRDAVLVVEGIENAEALESFLAGQAAQVGESGPLGELCAAVIALDAVDRCFRKSGLWRGNIYLAGAGALASVVSMVGPGGRGGRGRGEPGLGEPDVVVRELAALELAYLFPVAGKFRTGAYDGQVQYRLNGWGRALAGRLTLGRAAGEFARTCHRVICRHLAGERERYESFLAGLDVVRQDYAGNRLDEALALPVPVLV